MPGVKGRSGGHNAKSVKALKAAGTYRPDRHAGIENPEPPPGRPMAPLPLSAAEQAEWDRMVTRLERSKTLSLVDDGALFEYVQLFVETQDIKADNARLRVLSRKLQKALKDLRGSDLVEAMDRIVGLEKVMANHSVRLRQGHLALRQYLVEFGMTPASRNRVKLQNVGGAEKKKSKLLAFMGGKAAAPASEGAS